MCARVTVCARAVCALLAFGTAAGIVVGHPNHRRHESTTSVPTTHHVKTKPGHGFDMSQHGFHPPAQYSNTHANAPTVALVTRRLQQLTEGQFEDLFLDDAFILGEFLEVSWRCRLTQARHKHSIPYTGLLICRL